MNTPALTPTTVADTTPGFVVVQANHANPQWPVAYLTRFEGCGDDARSWDRAARLAHVFTDRNDAEVTALCVRSTYTVGRGWCIEVRAVAP